MKNPGFYVSLYIEQPNIFFPHYFWGQRTNDVESLCFAGYLHYEDLLRKESCNPDSIFSPAWLKVYHKGKLHTTLPTSKERVQQIINFFERKSNEKDISNQGTGNSKNGEGVL